MEWFYLIGICLMMYSLYRLKTSQPELSQKCFQKLQSKNLLLFWGIGSVLGVVGLAVLSVENLN